VTDLQLTKIHSFMVKADIRSVGSAPLYARWSPMMM
jgi:hypothetical protein